eukprot:m.138188 g.138188  ORF g.138188 m.138188 type:complete len:77 (-) comp15910_c0_seq1:45-275(-)
MTVMVSMLVLICFQWCMVVSEIYLLCLRCHCKKKESNSSSRSKASADTKRLHLRAVDVDSTQQRDHERRGEKQTVR